jgi:DNA-binding transcriptional LysR family regulator
MSPDHRLARRPTVDIGELTKERLLLPSRQYLTRHWFDTACQRAHLRPKVALESSAPHALIALARVGYGMAIVPSHTLFDAPIFALFRSPSAEHCSALGRRLRGIRIASSRRL